jgi:REP element-mobilizing transposase RayT
MRFRRYYIPNAIVFITNVVHRREQIFANSDHLELLLSTLREVKKLHPFHMVGYVL